MLSKLTDLLIPPLMLTICVHRIFEPLVSAVGDHKIASDEGFYGLILDNVLSESCKYISLWFYLC